MKIATLRAQVTLWSVGVVTIALALFAAGAAWSLRQELIENLDKDIKAEAHDFFIALKQQSVDWRDRRTLRGRGLCRVSTSLTRWRGGRR